MTLSKKQKIIIWTIVILVVILLGLDKRLITFQPGKGMTEILTFYGKQILPARMTVVVTIRERKDIVVIWNNVLFWVASQKYFLITGLVLIGAALIITSKKK